MEFFQLINIIFFNAVIHKFIDKDYFNKNENIIGKIHQCFLVTIGESLSIILYFFEQHFSKSKLKIEKKTYFFDLKIIKLKN